MSLIKRTCDFCQNNTLEHVYTPINSARGMEVFLCSRCGLLQSFPTVSYQSRPHGSMSADADRSSYRYTKDVISGRYEECFSQYIDFSLIYKVLDVGSNRGAFIKYLQMHYPDISILGVEPDESITFNYATLANVSVQTCRFEHAQLLENHFDFAYCAHTLEHADSARNMLLGIRRSLKPGGQLFLCVPRLAFYRDVIEEMFIDPHTYHFSYIVLKDFASKIGFLVEYAGNPQEPEIILLLKKHNDFDIGSSFEPADLSHATETKVGISSYKKEIYHNREKLKLTVQQLTEAADKFKVVVWGGGRIFDALVRFGHLNTDRIYMVVDKFLFRYAQIVHGCPLLSPDALSEEDPDNLLVFIASREYAADIFKEASAMGISKFIKFGDNI